MGLWKRPTSYVVPMALLPFLESCFTEGEKSAELQKRIQPVWVYVFWWTRLAATQCYEKLLEISCVVSGIFIFTPSYSWEMMQFNQYFSTGLVQPPSSFL